MDIKREYNELINDYEEFLNEISRLIERLLNSKNIPIAFEINKRVKTFESIQEKIYSNKFRKGRSLKELNDLIGLRIVVLFPEYKDKVINLLESNFIIIKKYNSNITFKEFGYNSIHLILKIKDKWRDHPTWETHTKKIFEVQVRTISEHIWAETSHNLFYKREENIPDILKRDLSRVSALLEIVDEKLQNIKNKIYQHFEYIRNAPYDEILKLDLNPESFRRVMIKNSNSIYNLNDSQNKILSSKVEKEFNILNANVLDEMISGNIKNENLSTEEFVEEVLKLLEIEKAKFGDKQIK